MLFVLPTLNSEEPTSTYDGNKVTWKVTRENLVEGFRLRAFTVK
jgi:hypothetical protein